MFSAYARSAVAYAVASASEASGTGSGSGQSARCVKRIYMCRMKASCKLRH